MIAPRSSTGLSSHTAAVLAYGAWWVTGLIFWFAERRDPFVRFHAAQAVAAFGFTALLIGVFLALAVLSLSFLPSAFMFFATAALVTWVGGMVLWVVVLFKAAVGEVWRIPGAADVADWLTSNW